MELRSGPAIKACENVEFLRHVASQVRLKYLVGIKWQDKIINNEVLQRVKMEDMEAMLIRAQLMGWPRAANE